ncbi:MAG: S-layer homology domain-containing protein [Clostridia bacterium]|nr:S-layer homology domain-containing protein [Clostridia bacterium]
MKTLKKFTALLLIFSMTASIDIFEVMAVPAPAFYDAGPGNWFYESVEYCYYKSYIHGMPDGKFYPNDELTREQFVMILFNISDGSLPYTGKDSGMKDVPDGRWYSRVISWAVENGLVAGISEGVFGIGQPIQRAALARLLYLYADKLGIDVSKKADLSDYTDAENVQDWMADGLGWAVETGIIKSTDSDEKILDPFGHATRAQCARMLMAFDEARDVDIPISYYNNIYFHYHYSSNNIGNFDTVYIYKEGQTLEKAVGGYPIADGCRYFPLLNARFVGWYDRVSDRILTEDDFKTAYEIPWDLNLYAVWENTETGEIRIDESVYLYA